ncbi:hypothetical protein O1L60_05680 [Streptomyces diastatochromogenes]|nr:hypothetical protein [Streptomyces diastatochromogenes]
MNEHIPVIREVDHGTARLLPDVDRERAWLLTVDGAPQSYVDLDDPAYLEFEYARRLAHVADGAAAPGAALDVVHLGGGALSLPRYVAVTRPGSRQEVVEADRGCWPSWRSTCRCPRARGPPCTGRTRGPGWRRRRTTRPT